MNNDSIIEQLVNHTPDNKKPFPALGDWHTTNAVALNYEEFAYEPMKKAYYEDYPTFKENRGTGKALGLAFCYGATEYNVMGTFPDMPKATAKQITSNFFTSLPVFNKYLKKLLKQATRDLYVKTFLGRRLFIPQLSKDQEFRVQMQGRNFAYNYPIQSFGGEHTRLAMYKVGEYIEDTQMYKWQGNNICNNYVKRIVSINESDVDDFLIEELEDIEEGNVQLILVNDSNEVISEWDKTLRLDIEYINEHNMTVVF